MSKRPASVKSSKNAKGLTPDPPSDTEQMWKALPSPSAASIAIWTQVEAEGTATGSTSSTLGLGASSLMLDLQKLGVPEDRAMHLIEDEDFFDAVQALLNHLGPIPALQPFLTGPIEDIEVAAFRYAASGSLDSLISTHISLDPAPSSPIRPSTPEINPFEPHASEDPNPPQTPRVKLEGKGKAALHSDPVVQSMTTIQNAKLSKPPAPPAWKTVIERTRNEVRLKEKARVEEENKGKEKKEENEKNDERKRADRKEEEKKSKERREEDREKQEARRKEEQERDEKRRKEEERKREEKRKEEERKREEKEEERGNASAPAAWKAVIEQTRNAAKVNEKAREDEERKGKEKQEEEERNEERKRAERKQEERGNKERGNKDKGKPETKKKGGDKKEEKKGSDEERKNEKKRKEETDPLTHAAGVNLESTQDEDQVRFTLHGLSLVLTLFPYLIERIPVHVDVQCRHCRRQ
jgi:hypothetical protein